MEGFMGIQGIGGFPSWEHYWAVCLLVSLLPLAISHDLSAQVIVQVPLVVNGSCRCCARLIAVNSSIDLQGSAWDSCKDIAMNGQECRVGTVIIGDNASCPESLVKFFIQRLQLLSSAITFPLTIARPRQEQKQYWFFSNSIGEVVGDSESFCKVHAITHANCAADIQQEARARYSASAHYLDDWISSPTKIYLWPVEHPDYFAREQEIQSLGLQRHPHIKQINNSEEADLVLYLLTGPPTEAGAIGKVHSSKLVIIDYDDEPAGIFQERYLAYFKRSWVSKSDGKLIGYPEFTHSDRVFPLPFSVLPWYEFMGPRLSRDFSFSCTIRPTSELRMRMLSWCTTLVISQEVEGAFVGQVSDTLRKGYDDHYFSLLARSRIIVTLNPPDWDGDHRLWESLASGALVMTDRLYIPLDPPLIEGVHYIMYNNSDYQDFRNKLMYYLNHPTEAEDIGRRGREFVLANHMPEHRMTYISQVARRLRYEMDRHESGGGMTSVS